MVGMWEYMCHVAPADNGFVESPKLVADDLVGSDNAWLAGMRARIDGCALVQDNQKSFHSFL